MKILAINTGSSSLKFQMFEMPKEEIIVTGIFERIGIEGSFYKIALNGEKLKFETEVKNHKQAIEILVDKLIELKVVNSLEEIKGIGHRVVHGGEIYKESTLIDNGVVSNVEEFIDLAPLHIPANLTGIELFEKFIPSAKGVAVFDTAFHQSMNEETYLYAVPYDWYKKYGVRKYGFHGISHKYIAQRMKDILPAGENKIISCHLGSGASITAIENGKCVDTSMGFTPNSGLIMGTRSGDIDACIIPYIVRKTDLSMKDVELILSKKSGVIGISGISSDMRDIEAGLEKNNEDCILTQNMFVKRIIEYVAKYFVELKGCDALVFTAGVGENSPYTRNQIIEELKVLGFEIDKEKNDGSRGKEILISSNNSKIKIYVIPTDEEIMIARDTYNLIK